VKIAPNATLEVQCQRRKPASATGTHRSGCMAFPPSFVRSGRRLVYAVKAMAHATQTICLWRFGKGVSNGAQRLISTHLFLVIIDAPDMRMLNDESGSATISSTGEPGDRVTETTQYLQFPPIAEALRWGLLFSRRVGRRPSSLVLSSKLHSVLRPAHTDEFSGKG
jgi:hypothetical protein